MRRIFLEFFYEKKNRRWGEELMTYWSRRSDEYTRMSKAFTPNIVLPQEVQNFFVLEGLGTIWGHL